ncbi:MAG TPA: PLDc N-terminal domain-containing protein [Gaiellaceae bacterium]|nr:PLDc N-terminal domain-containing protein [Gaiellaceae bacterium]
MLWWLLVMFVVAVWAVTLFDIFRRWNARSTGTSVAWLIAIIIFPVVGTIVYFVVNDLRRPEREAV